MGSHGGHSHLTESPLLFFPSNGIHTRVHSLCLYMEKDGLALITCFLLHLTWIPVLAALLFTEKKCTPVNWRPLSPGKRGWSVRVSDVGRFI